MFTTLDTRPDETSSKRRWLVLAVMSVGTLIVFIDNTVVNTALPAISVDLGASISTLQWVVDSYVLVLAGLLLLGGSLGDRFGRKKWMTVGLVIFGLGSVGAALSTTAGGLIGFRGVQGLGASLVLPATLSIITTCFPVGNGPRRSASGPPSVVLESASARYSGDGWSTISDGVRSSGCTSRSWQSL